MSKSKCTKHFSFGALLEVEMSKKCAEHISKSKCTKHHGRTTFGSWDVKKVHAVVARSTFPSRNVQSTSCSDQFWKLRWRKSARRCGAKHISKSKCTKHTNVGPRLEVAMSKKVRGVVARSTFPSQNVQSTSCSDHFWTFRCLFAWQAQGIVHLVKSEQNVRVLWHLQKWWQVWGIWRGSAKMHFPWQARYKRHVHQSCYSGRSGRWFPERGCVLEQFWEDDFAWQVRHFVWPGISFSWQAQYFGQAVWKNRKTHWYEAVSSPLNFPFLKEVPQNCFVFDVVNFENWGSLAALFRFWCRQLRKLRKSRRIVSFLTLSRSKIAEVLQNSCVFKQIDRQIDR